MRPTTKDLLAVCATHGGVGPVELAEKLDRGLNATYLAVSDLERLGLLRRDDRGRYHVVEAQDLTAESESANGQGTRQVGAEGG